MTVLVFELFGRDSSASRTMDRFGRSTDDAGQRVRNLGRDADGAARSFNPLEVVLNGVNRALVQNVASMAKATAAAGGLASTALTLAPHLATAAQTVWSVVEAAGAASPALVGMGAAGAVAFAAVKLGMSDFGAAIKEANTPAQIKKVNEALASLHPEARRVAEEVRAMHEPFDTFKRDIQGALFKDLADDVKLTGNTLMNTMRPGMVAVGAVTNSVVGQLLRWGSSNEGVKATSELANAAYIGMARLEPSIVRVLTSLGNMIGRVAQVGTAAGAGGLGGVLDSLADKMDKVDAESVSTGLANLSNTYHTVKDAVVQGYEAVKTATQFYREHRTEIGAVSDVLSVLAIAFGGPVVAVGAAVGLIIRHWDDLKAAKQSLTEGLASPVGVGFLEDMRTASGNIVPALQGAWSSIWEAIGPVLTEIWNKIKNELLPAFGDFVAAVSPIVAIVVDVLGPVVAGVFGGIVSIISGAISVITGILQVFTGLLTGDWGKLWEGIKNILSGAWEIIVGLFNTFLFGRLLGIAGKLPGLIGGLFGKAGTWAVNAIKDMGVWVERSLSSLIERIPGVLGNVTRLLYEAGKGIVQGLINGIKSMINAAGGAMRAVVDKIKAYLPWSPAKEGPFSGSGAPDVGGRNITGMVASGMVSNLPRIVSAAHQMASAAGLGAPGLGGIPTGFGPALASGGGGAGVAFDFKGAAYDKFAALVLEVVRESVKTRGGNVQNALGQAA